MGPFKSVIFLSFLTAELLCIQQASSVESAEEASPVRLVDGSNSCSGRVQVFHRKIWGTVCYSGWDLLDANVVCSELGCGEAKEVKSAEFFGLSPEQIWLTNMKCSGNETSLGECPVGGGNKWSVTSCLFDLYAGVICEPRTRLVGGINSCSGQVEVFYDGTWGKVCDDNWNLSQAAVVCREVGCGAVIEAKSFSYFGEASGQIWMDGVVCSGNEYALSKCAHLEWGVNDCNYTEGAGVICQPVITLVGGHDACSGRVEVLHSGLWGTVCADNWDVSAAAVVCKEIGCGNIEVWTYGPYFGASSKPVWMDNVNCTGEEAALSTCTFQGWGTNNCPVSYYAGVMCGLPVRLVHGNSICSGRVEVLHDGQWGTVSDNGWNLTDAAVVCREVGCGDVIEVKGGAFFGQGSGPVWMDSVDCSGNESSLIHCKIDHWQKYNPDHLHDAGVICSESSFSTSGAPVQGSETRVKVLLRIEVQTDPMLDPNDPKTISKLSEEIEEKLHLSKPFSLIWKTQKDGKILVDLPQKKKPAKKCT